MTAEDSPDLPLDLVLQAPVDHADRPEELWVQVLSGQAVLAGRLALLEDAPEATRDTRAGPLTATDLDARLDRRARAGLTTSADGHGHGPCR